MYVCDCRYQMTRPDTESQIYINAFNNNASNKILSCDEQKQELMLQLVLSQAWVRNEICLSIYLC